MKTIALTLCTTFILCTLSVAQQPTPAFPPNSVQPSADSDKKFAIRPGDIHALELSASYHERSYHHTVLVTLTRRRTLEWRLASLGAWVRDQSSPGFFIQKFPLLVEVAEGWTGGDTPNVEEHFLHTFRFNCDSLEQALARMKLLEPKCVIQALEEDKP